MHYQFASWFPDGKRILVLGNQQGHGLRLYVQSLSDGGLTPITPEGITAPHLGPTPDGRFVLARRLDGKAMLFPVQGGPPLETVGLTTGEPVQWATSGHTLYVHQRGEMPSRVYRLDLDTGHKDLWKQFVPADPTGISDIGRFAITPDGTAYAYAYSRLLSNLYLVEGLR